jgi:hypothetical protein
LMKNAAIGGTAPRVDELTLPPRSTTGTSLLLSQRAWVCWPGASQSRRRTDYGRYDLTSETIGDVRPMSNPRHGYPKQAAASERPAFPEDHFVCDGRASLPLRPGRYRHEIERGPEYQRQVRTAEVEPKLYGSAPPDRGSSTAGLVQRGPPRSPAWTSP